MALEIKVKYHTDVIPLKKLSMGSWIDLRAAETIEMKKDEYRLIPLGVSIELPYGYEALVVPRSSTFKNFGIIQANSAGIIDQNYNGDGDKWWFPAIALRDTVVNKNDRICQFRIQKEMDVIQITTVDKLYNKDRGGIGSTGIN